jgi:hypothetical protein
MRTSATITGCLALLTVGYVLGASQVLSPGYLLAQAGGAKAKSKLTSETQAAQGMSDESKTKIKAAADALKAAMDSLQSEGRYDSAIKGVNSFAVMTGGGNSLAALKSAGGVDPETFAALYAGLASDAVVGDLGRDADGKLTYKGRVVRMYPVSVIRSAYARRAEITGEDLLPEVVDPSTKSKPKAKTEPAEEGTEEEK